MEWGIVCPRSHPRHTQFQPWGRDFHSVTVSQVVSEVQVDDSRIFLGTSDLKFGLYSSSFFSFVCSCRKLCLIFMNVIQHEIRYNCFLYFKSMYYINYVGWDDFLLARVPPPVLKIFSKFSCLYFGCTIETTSLRDNYPKHQTKM